MKRCPKCNIEVNTQRKTCPLCLTVLVSDNQEYEKKYPTPEFTPQKKSIWIRILSFFSIIAISASVVVNVATYKETKSLWSIIVIMSIGYFWLLLKSTFSRKDNVPFRLLIQEIGLSILIFIIDRFTGYTRWSVNYVIPFILMATLIALTSFVIGSRIRYVKYFLHIIGALILAAVPIILWLVKVVTVFWPALSSASLAFVIFVGMVVFGDRETKEEIKKRFHI